MQTKQENTTQPRKPIEVEINELMHVMQNFSKVLLRENDLLIGAKFREIETLQNDKRHYVTEYKSKVNTLSKRKAEFTNVDTPLAEKLILARTEFVKLLNTNLQALSAAKTSSRRLVERIINTARDTVEKKTNYNGGGSMMRSNPQSATSVRYNQEL